MTSCGITAGDKHIGKALSIVSPLCWGKFFSFCFSFSHLLVIVYSFTTRSLLRAVCKFRYSLLSRPYLLPVFTDLLV